MAWVEIANVISTNSPLIDDVILSTPQHPGLQIDLPAGRVIRDRDGAVVTELTITPIPVDRPPLSLPLRRLSPPCILRRKPGGAYPRPYGARIVYPNITRMPPGMRTDFWKLRSDREALAHIRAGGRHPGRSIGSFPKPGVVAHPTHRTQVYRPAPTGPSAGGGGGGLHAGPQPVRRRPCRPQDKAS